MRLTSDYIVKNRKLLISIILSSCPDGSEIEIEGKIPKELNKTITTQIGSNGKRYIINDNSRNILIKVFVEKDEEIKNGLLGLNIYYDSNLILEGYHLYDYGSESDSGKVVYFHNSTPNNLMQELISKMAIEIEK